MTIEEQTRYFLLWYGEISRTFTEASFIKALYVAYEDLSPKEIRARYRAVYNEMFSLRPIAEPEPNKPRPAMTVEIHLSEIGYQVDFFDEDGLAMSSACRDFAGNYAVDDLTPELELVLHNAFDKFAEER